MRYVMFGVRTGRLTPSCERWFDLRIAHISPHKATWKVIFQPFLRSFASL